jgi:MFS family permease
MERTKAFLYCRVNVNLACFTGFLPVIIRSMELSALRTQVMTIPVYCCAAVATLIFGFLSDKYAKRRLMLVSAFSITAMGWIFLLAGTCLIGMGVYPSVILTLIWANVNVIGYTKR